MQQSPRVSPGQKTVLFSTLLGAVLLLGLACYLLYGDATEPLLQPIETPITTVP